MLFVVFSIIYLFTVGGNLVIICLIWVTPSLHTPVYFFLVNRSFLEMCCVTSVMPQMLVHLLMEVKAIRAGGCAAQIYMFTILGLTEWCLLAAMAYDYLLPTALCSPNGPSGVFEIGCSILDHWGGGGVSPDYLDLHSALLWNRKDRLSTFCVTSCL